MRACGGRGLVKRSIVTRAQVTWDQTSRAENLGSRTRAFHPRALGPRGPRGQDSRTRCLDRQHRAGGVEQDPLRVRAEDQLADRGAAAQADHDQLAPRSPRRPSPGPRRARRRGRAGAPRARSPASSSGLPDRVQLGLVAGGLLAVEVLAAAVAVDDDQTGVAQTGLARGGARAAWPSLVATYPTTIAIVASSLR